MRLTCPNCGARYEVPDEVIPMPGRDVQCSNCGQTWYFTHPDHRPEEDEEPVDSWENPEIAPPEGDEDDGPASSADRPARRRDLDPAVADVLREEARREQQARAAESGGLESQPDLGLSGEADETERRARQARERMSRLRGEDEGAPDASHTAPQDDETASARRRGLLPEIDEIGPELDEAPSRGAGAHAEHDDFAAESAAPARGGFRAGFWLVVLVALILAGVYVYAPWIAEQVPQIAGPLESYVGTVNTGRMWLDDRMAGFMAWVDRMLAETGRGGAGG
ncbi:zinc-ribbon domain-containing protein [Roseovarius salinarum]|uniref:zinc-ribbon domain-containing protein n=1 Tax=Roseovarius salinarum TaxID=1981892 RepID=UPI000C3362EA|nr:zinc-ribbon domain-containing protein [Roseovarius salinarum]